MIDFKMPKVRVGDQVCWRPGQEADREPRIAFVTAVGEHSLDLTVIEGGLHNLMARSSVRHRTDPRLKAEEIEENGIWEESPQLKQMAAMAKEIEDLKRRLPAAK